MHHRNKERNGFERGLGARADGRGGRLVVRAGVSGIVVVMHTMVTPPPASMTEGRREAVVKARSPATGRHHRPAQRASAGDSVRLASAAA
jgi:hypothetical protein